MVRPKSQLLYPQEIQAVLGGQEAVWNCGSVWMGPVNFATIGIRSPDLPARKESLYWLHNTSNIYLSTNVSRVKRVQLDILNCAVNIKHVSDIRNFITLHYLTFYCVVQSFFCQQMHSLSKHKTLVYT
jgi:hypothetical protein